VRAAQFWWNNKDELLEAFPPSEGYTRLQQRTATSLSVCSLGTDLTLFEDPDGCIYGMVKDFPCFEIFLREYEAFMYADFYTHNTAQKEDKQAYKLYFCR